ncbi:uncharacterized protein Dvir_GJ26111 [Drosophila virilis]|uniref:Uncharacterized protein n=1 Tax=Drosophila virilis TaxID=7244 RepID=A0A0Q9WDG8_DROVI|nr:uncharacterized protein Dvir_GJ26111 [Drosophila virilis]
MSFCELCKARNAVARRAAAGSPRQTMAEPPPENFRPLRGQTAKPAQEHAVNRKRKASRVRPKTRDQACQTAPYPLIYDSSK